MHVMSKETRERVGRSPSPAAPRSPAPTPRRDEPKREGVFSPPCSRRSRCWACSGRRWRSHHVIDEHAPQAGASGPGSPAAPDAASRAAVGGTRGGLQSRLFALEQRQKLIDRRSRRCARAHARRPRSCSAAKRRASPRSSRPTSRRLRRRLRPRPSHRRRRRGRAARAATPRGRRRRRRAERRVRRPRPTRSSPAPTTGSSLASARR